jgi:hypothetical protein
MINPTHTHVGYFSTPEQLNEYLFNHHYNKNNFEIIENENGFNLLIINE